MRLTIRSIMHIVLAVLLGALPLAGTAQETRYPTNGIAILDCEPMTPAPEDSCLLRIPPGYDYQGLVANALGDEEGEFQLARDGGANMPDGLRLNATILLVDLSPGPGGGRRSSFETEKGLISSFVDALPRDEQIAIYGFNEGLRRLTDFTSDRKTLRDAVQALKLQGTNTRIATFVGDSIDILAARDDVLIKKLVLVSDGQEEGNRPVREVVDRALEQGVTISAIGNFWRRPGDEVTGGGMDYLRQLTEGTGGAVQQVLLQRPDQARDAVAGFSASFAKALERSALILPEGTARASEISMTLLEPTPGAANQKTSREIQVTFQPAQPATDPGDATTGPETTELEAATIFGIDALWVYSGAGLLLFLGLLGLFLAVRGRTSEEDALPADEGLSLDDQDIIEEQPTPVPQPAAIAWLVFSDGARRAAITGSRANVGRSGSNDIVIDDESVSRLHAQIHRNRDGGFSVTDLDSLNGTSVGELPIKGTHPVRLGETLKFGSITAKMVAA